MNCIDNLIAKYDNELRAWTSRAEIGICSDRTATKIETIKEVIHDLNVLKESEDGQCHTEPNRKKV